MVVTCSVNGCDTKSGKECRESFHRFPADPGDRQKWLDNLQLVWDGVEPWQPKREDRVCSRHFTPESYSQVSAKGAPLMRPRLQPGAFPTLHMGVESLVHTNFTPPPPTVPVTAKHSPSKFW